MTLYFQNLDESLIDATKPDGILTNSVMLDSHLEQEGLLIIQTHNEIWLDEFSLTGTAIRE